MQKKIEVTRIIRKTRLTYWSEKHPFWLLTVRTDSNQGNKRDMEFFTIKGHDLDYFREFQPGMVVSLSFYRRHVLGYRGNTITKAQEIWIVGERRRRVNGMLTLQPYHYPEDENNFYRAFKDEAPEDSKDDEMYYKRKLFKL